MTIRTTSKPGLGLLAALAACLFLAAPASAELARWDQDRVTSYAEELATATQELYRALGSRPTYLNQANQRAYYQARDDVRVMNSSAKHLLSKLKDGEGRDETAPIFKRIRLLQRSAQDEGRKASIPEDIMDKAAPVGGSLLKLRPYYEAEPDPDTRPEAR